MSGDGRERRLLRREHGGLETLAADARYALRGLRNRRGFTAVALLTLALGIGANAAVFSVLNGVVLRPLPYAAPERLVALASVRETGERGGLSPGDVGDYREAIEGLAGIGYYVLPYLDDRVLLTGGEQPESVRGVRASANLFDVLGVEPVIGRGFRPEDEAAGAIPAVLLSHGEWLRRFGGDRSVVERELEINGAPSRVVGVLPPTFEAPLPGAQPQLWATLPLTPELAQNRGSLVLRPIARLGAGVELAGVAQQVEAVHRGIAARHPDTSGEHEVEVTPLAQALTGDVAPVLLLLLGSAVLVLLVACVNLALLLLGRNAARSRELAIRSALGAGRERLVRQLLLESGLIGVGGAVLGVALAAVATPALLELAPVALPRAEGIGVDGRVLLFALGAALATVVLFGGGPALAATKDGAFDTLRERGQAGGGRGAGRLSRGLIVAETAVVLVLLVAAGLSVGTLGKLLEVEPGFEPEGRLVLELDLPADPNRYGTTAAVAGFLERLETHVAALPGVRAAGTVTNLPLNPSSWNGSLYIDGVPIDRGRTPQVDWEFASPGYFRAAGIPLLEGRAFEERDREGAPLVAVINGTMARRFWPGGGALGARINGNRPEGPWRTVVGIVGDVKQQGLGAETRPQMYVAHGQIFPYPHRQLLVWTADGEPTRQLPAVRAALRALEPRLVIGEVRTLGDVVTGSTAGERFNMVLLALFGGLALLLGLAGIYGVVSYALSRSTREIGVRMAMGADRGRILRWALRQGVQPVAAGALLGSAAALGVTRLMQGLLFGVSPTEPLVFAAAAGLLMGTAAAAVLPPALRASRADPAAVLRAE